MAREYTSAPGARVSRGFKAVRTLCAHLHIHRWQCGVLARVMVHISPIFLACGICSLVVLHKPTSACPYLLLVVSRPGSEFHPRDWVRYVNALATVGYTHRKGTMHSSSFSASGPCIRVVGMLPCGINIQLKSHTRCARAGTHLPPPARAALDVVDCATRDVHVC